MFVLASFENHLGRAPRQDGAALSDEEIGGHMEQRGEILPTLFLAHHHVANINLAGSIPDVRGQTISVSANVEDPIWVRSNLQDE
jgi:hypothetical protein